MGAVVAKRTSFREFQHQFHPHPSLYQTRAIETKKKKEKAMGNFVVKNVTQHFAEIRRKKEKRKIEK